MPNEKHLDLLMRASREKDPSIWHNWVYHRDDIEIDLEYAQLSGLDLSHLDLTGSILDYAVLKHTNLTHAVLIGSEVLLTDFSDANLEDSTLHMLDFTSSDLFRTSFVNAEIEGCFFGDNLDGADFTGATLEHSVFANSDLSTVKGLETVKHYAPSTIGIDTIYKSKGKISDVFLRGCGVPDEVISMAKSIAVQPRQYFSVMIKNAPEDESFALKLYSDLQLNGVQVYFPSEHLPTGAKRRETIYDKLQQYDKVIVILSKYSIQNEEIALDIQNAIEKEKRLAAQSRSDATVLFPIRLDEAVAKSKKTWAIDLREVRSVADFSNWTNPLVYQNAINKILRDLDAHPLN